MSVEIADLGLLGQDMLDAIIRDEGQPIKATIKRNNSNGCKRIRNWFDNNGGVPKIPTVIYEFDEDENIIPVTYTDMINHPKVKQKRVDGHQGKKYRMRGDNAA